MPSELTVHAAQQGPMAFTISDGAETTICPVWALLKAGTPVTSSFTVATV